MEGMTREGEHVVSAGGGQVVSSKAGNFERWVDLFFQTVGFVSDYVHKSSMPHKVPHNPSCNVLYARKAFQVAGGFDENIWPCEDLELDLRLADFGFEAVFVPNACVEHRRPQTLLSFLQMMRKYGFGHAQLVKKRGLCQPLQRLAWMAPITLGLWGWLAHRKPLGGVSILAAGLILLLAILSCRSKSVARGPLMLFLTLVAILGWLFGFYCGLGGGRRIAR